ncbi:alpha-L-arabinofuranosidase domain protein [Kribbella flavida DSM 17836]|uniref:non-reducing end alpha-L-arabinofuranosidase n=1 Tax=Kribbella flavida (strain DSM 17836 / JCM 10339 / NBRC 14399) TaxID=479435 RepID=D2PYP5_KRIFD|nr:alpha-N-arabinofuranosidase [Kribbella flavida]ADB29891.1 alpha-L-arabinofuranosidase domain protein [Kribbella flavida DSM 17836]
MTSASLILDPAFTVAPVRRRTFGTFVEHMGRCVYTGIHEPGHPTADEDGFRKDVLELTRELGVSLVRYPGGNFVSGYRWEDGVGPREDRPRRLELAWHSIETNQFGLDEFMRWCAKAEVEPMMAINLGTRGVQEALDLQEYTNHPGGTALSDLRGQHGAASPYGIKVWCLGNEMDGPWQIGHKTASEYGRLAAETARAMRMVEPGLELVACGSSSSAMPTFGSWEREVLRECYDLVDHISCHAYYGDDKGDPASFLASAVDMDRFIDSVVASADHVGAELKSSKRIDISFDEWNVWYGDRSRRTDGPADAWEVAPRRIEDEYNLTDAVVVGNLLISLLRHSDRVAVACLAQLANVIAPIRTEPDGPAWRQPTFHPFAITSRLAAGQVLRVETTSPLVATDKFGEVPAVDAVATYDEGKLAVFGVNRSLNTPIELTVDLTRTGVTGVQEALTMSGEDRLAVNSATHPDRVVPHPNDTVKLRDGKLTLTLPAISWTALSLS